MSEAWIVDGVRSPRGKGNPDGALHDIHPQELLAQILRALHERVGFPVEDVEDVQVGNASNEGDHGMCIGRLAVLAAGWPVTVPGLTVNRYCGSGQQALNHAAIAVMAGQQDVVVAAGVESMSRMGSGPPPRFDGNNGALLERHPLVPQGISADLIATIERFDRQQLDAYGLRSQERAAKAIAGGRFEQSVVPVHRHDGSVALTQDELPRPGTTLRGLAGLRASFEKLGGAQLPGFAKPFDDMARDRYPDAGPISHLHHAGNSSGVADGAAALLVVSPEYARAHNMRPRARVVATASAGAEPVIMLTAPPAAVRRALAKAGLRVADIDLWEVNEAFAAAGLYVERELGLDPERVNVNGGAIALGHPIGATGPMLVQTALDELERRDQQRALVTMCTGGGMATATIIERA